MLVHYSLDISHSYFPADYEVENPTEIETKLEKKLRRLKLGAFTIHDVPRPLIKLGRNLLRRAFPVPKRILTDPEKEFAYNELKEDMAKLHHIYGVDVCKWGFDI